MYTFEDIKKQLGIASLAARRGNVALVNKYKAFYMPGEFNVDDFGDWAEEEIDGAYETLINLGEEVFNDPDFTHFDSKNRELIKSMNKRHVRILINAHRGGLSYYWIVIDGTHE